MIKAVIFDLFGVLTANGFKQFCDLYFPEDPEKRRRARELVTSHDAGIITLAQYRADLADLARISADAVKEHMSRNEPNIPLINYIKKELKPKYKISVLSNSGGPYIYQIIDNEDTKIFDDVVLSYQYKMVKPQIEIFELAAQRLGVLSSECVMVDDNKQYCEAAEVIGMRTVFYQDFPQFKMALQQLLS